MSTQTVAQLAENIIRDDLSPIMAVMSNVSVYIGVGMIMYGIVRLIRHSHSNMMHRVSPMGTAITFVSGAILISYTPELSVLSNSLFGQTDIFIHTCPGAEPSGVNFCPLLGYVDEIKKAKGGGEEETVALKALAFGILFVFGTLSFIRGWLQLVKVSDGGGSGGATMSKAVTYIIAGAAGVNAENIYGLLSNVLRSQL